MSETEELLWIASQEKRTIPFDMIQFACENNIPLSHLLDMPESDFKELNPKIVSQFMQNKNDLPIAACQQIFNNLIKERINLIPFCDTFYPENLRKIQTTKIPCMLYHQGKMISIQNGVAIVGTRNASTRAIEMARDLGRTLSKYGFMIISGLARGIDAAAMRGSVSVDGKTIAVLPWIHNPYPPEHEKLLEEIKQNGSVISENYVSGGSINKYKFLQRNAIISALSEALVAVESSYSGGTRWQVELAISQKKMVIAIEPEKSNTLSYNGFEKFVQKGAIPAKNVSQVLDILKHKIKLQQVLDDYNSNDADSGILDGDNDDFSFLDDEINSPLTQ